MSIRPTELSWANYKKAAKNLKLVKPGITPQQIIGRIGYPLKNGQRIFITSDGKGGVKQRQRTAHDARNALRQKRRRIQTGQLTPEQSVESRQKKDNIRAQGLEADHFNEIAFIGEQLERLERSGGDVQAALQRLRDAGYALGDNPDNLQGLSPEDNKAKYQDSKDLQNYLGSREALGQSPSARNTNLIVTGEDLSQRTTSFPQQNQGSLTTTSGQVRYTPDVLPGFDTSEQPGPSVTAAPGTYSSPQVMETNSNNYGNDLIQNLIDSTQDIDQSFKDLSDIVPVIKAGQVILQGIGSLAVGVRL